MFSPTSRVWVYQNTQKIEDTHLSAITKDVQYFAQQWLSHSQLLKAQGEVLHNRFIVLTVDEAANASASGCSIDSSVRFLKHLENVYQLDVFNRLYFSYLDDKNEVQTVSSTTFATLYKEGVINGETLVFDTLVTTKADLDTKFVKKLNESWHKRLV